MASEGGKNVGLSIIVVFSVVGSGHVFSICMAVVVACLCCLSPGFIRRQLLLKLTSLWHSWRPTGLRLHDGTASAQALLTNHHACEHHPAATDGQRWNENDHAHGDSEGLIKVGMRMPARICMYVPHALLLHTYTHTSTHTCMRSASIQVQFTVHVHQ